MRSPRLLLAAALLAPIAVAAPGSSAPAAGPAAADEITASPNLKAVGRLPYRGGTDLELTTINKRRYVVAGAQNNYNPTTDYGVRIVDVTNPARPTVAGFVPCNVSQTDVQVKGGFIYVAVDFGQKGDGGENRTDCWTQMNVSPQAGMIIIDARNPKKPRAVGFLPVKSGAAPSDSLGAHNVSVHPTRPVVYISDSDTATNTRIHIADVSRPNAPKMVKAVELTPGDAIHDITFNAKGTRAFIASGFTHSAIADTTDPLNPKFVARIQDPAINFHHQADPTPDGKFLIISDELAGAQGLAFCPGGGLHVYDITTEAVPRKVGAFFIPDSFVETRDTNNGPRVTAGPVKPFRCTSHMFRISPDGKTMTVAWYSQGIQVLDLSNLTGVSAGAQGTSAPVGIQRTGFWKVRFGDAWSAKMDDRGFVYTGDTQRGMDVVRFTKPAAGSVHPGYWLTPEQALARGLRDKAQAGANTYFCFDRTYRAGQAAA
jgi:hypothetical protein